MCIATTLARWTGRIDPDDTLYGEYRALGMPVSVFVNPEGIVTRVVNGLILLDQMEKFVSDATS